MPEYLKFTNDTRWIGLTSLLLAVGSIVPAVTARNMMAGASAAELHQQSGQILSLLALTLLLFFAAVYCFCRWIGLPRSLAVVIVLVLFSLLALWLSVNLPEPLMNLVLGQASPLL